MDTAIQEREAEQKLANAIERMKQLYEREFGSRPAYLYVGRIEAGRLERLSGMNVSLGKRFYRGMQVCVVDQDNHLNAG